MPIDPITAGIIVGGGLLGGGLSGLFGAKASKATAKAIREAIALQREMYGRLRKFGEEVITPQRAIEEKELKKIRKSQELPEPYRTMMEKERQIAERRMREVYSQAGMGYSTPFMTDLSALSRDFAMQSGLLREELINQQFNRYLSLLDREMASYGQQMAAVSGLASTYADLAQVQSSIQSSLANQLGSLMGNLAYITAFSDFMTPKTQVPTMGAM